jgi:hypothetical protein
MEELYAGPWLLADVYRVAIIQLTILGEHILFMNIELKLSDYIFFLIVLLQFVLG